MTSGQPLVFDRTATQTGTAIAHADNSADITLSEPGTYVAVYSGTAAPQTGATFPESNLLTFTLNGAALNGAAAQHVFNAATDTAPQSMSQVFTVTSVPATLQVNSSGGDYLYSNTSLSVFQI